MNNAKLPAILAATCAAALSRRLRTHQVGVATKIMNWLVMPEIEQTEDEIKPNFVKRQKLQRIQKIQVTEFSQTSPQR